MRESIIDFCTLIGSNSLLVQGAGGNVSWKEKNILWVKASGTWLSRAKEEDIFVPVDLSHLNSFINDRNFTVIPKVLKSYTLRPSIETLLHALMPQKVVVHLHAVEVLSHLVRKNCDVANIVGYKFPYALIDYYKPGEELAIAVHYKIQKTPQVGIIFMKNHGIVVGGDSVAVVQEIIGILSKLFYQPPISDVKVVTSTKAVGGYTILDDLKLQQLVFNKTLFDRLRQDWALYPDHVVFLGGQPQIYHNIKDIDNSESDIIFVENAGVFAKGKLSHAKVAQLRCYYDILARQRPENKLNSLSPSQIGELLNWDAEHYRCKKV